MEGGEGVVRGGGERVGGGWSGGRVVGVERVSEWCRAHLVGREEARVRPAVAKRHAKALRGADGDVGAPELRRLQRGEREEVGGDSELRARGLGLGGEAAVVEDAAVGRRVLHERAAHLLGEFEGLVVAGHHLYAEAFRACYDHGERLFGRWRVVRVVSGGWEWRESGEGEWCE